jgi:hypothetical protein
VHGYPLARRHILEPAMTATATLPATLPSRERLVRAFTGQPLDRLPYGVGLGW